MDALFPLQLLFEVLQRSHSLFSPISSAIVPPHLSMKNFDLSIYLYRNNSSTEGQGRLDPGKTLTDESQPLSRTIWVLCVFTVVFGNSMSSATFPPLKL